MFQRADVAVLGQELYSQQTGLDPGQRHLFGAGDRAGRPGSPGQSGTHVTVHGTQIGRAHV